MEQRRKRRRGDAEMGGRGDGGNRQRFRPFYVMMSLRFSAEILSKLMPQSRP